MLHIKAQGQSLHCFWRSFLKGFTTHGHGLYLGHVTKPSCIFFFFHYSHKLSNDIWFVEGQIMTLTFDIHVASLNH